MLQAFIEKSNRWPAWVWVIVSGLAVGFGSQAYSAGLLWLIALFPLFLIFDKICNESQLTSKQKTWRILGACWGVGCIAATFAVPFMIHSIHVFGQLPQWAGVLITSLGYGSEVALVLFVLFGLPVLFLHRRNGWDIVFRLSLFLALEPYYPKLFPWSIGKFAFLNMPWISQTADIIGSWGLGFYVVGFNFLLLLFWRQKLLPAAINTSLLLRFNALYWGLLILGLTYGAWRSTDLLPKLSQGEALHVAAIQPNFSLQRLASNPNLVSSKRENNIGELFKDSIKALNELPNDPNIPKLVVWPESVYPYAYFKNLQARDLVNQFAASHHTSILFTSIDWEETRSGKQYYGVSVLVGPDGKVKGRYNKIYLIPFGEFIPGAELFPAFGRWIKNLAPNVSEFKRGEEFSVFALSPDHPISGAICFDAFSQDISRNMARNGAKLMANLSNLAWFGDTNGSRHIELMLYWSAIENRTPFLFISNNGETVFLNSMGAVIGERLALNEQGSLSQTIFLQQHYSFYREHREWVRAGFALLLLLSALLGHRYGKIFKRASPTARDLS
jgi:apolipoprotein N-acyltransferase